MATEAEAGRRLDTIVAERLTELSRSCVGRLIRTGHVTVNGLIKKSGYIVRCDDAVRSEIPPPEPVTCKPEPIPLSILYEDSDIIVLNKPSGLVVHPAAGHWSGTLVNALLYHCSDLQGIGGELRPGIVHRLDKDTSGVMVVAKNDMANEGLSRQFKNRLVQKQYLALVYGTMKESAGTISLPVGRHPTDRKRLSIKTRKGRFAETRWKTKEALSCATLLELDLQTGRTHQIRVHCAAMGHPVVGDATYGGKKRWKDAPLDVQDLLRFAGRQMLHAWRLAFAHPRTGELVGFESPLPKDMASLIDAMRSFRCSS